jgi:hypothetical protein
MNNNDNPRAKTERSTVGSIHVGRRAMSSNVARGLRKTPNTRPSRLSREPGSPGVDDVEAAAKPESPAAHRLVANRVVEFSG